ncbi:hypothetical protein ACH47C_22445 [Streptomyces rishiriensis]|uniref:hypothetical protein n=1 Tax=Streptomyces rishiriensis TaxID=68264 RepID=UPI000D592E5F|nr:hypothetical protein [Streptomyces rishiriensis]
MPGSTTESQTQNWNTALKYIAGRKAAEESLGFVAHVSATVRDTEDAAAVVPAVARTCVPFFAGAVSLDAETTHDRAVFHGSDELAAVVDALRGLAAETGQRQIVISEHEGLAAKTDPRHLELLREGGGDSAVVISLAYRGLSGGHLILVRQADHRRGAFSPGDFALACEVADRVGAFNALAGLTARSGK